MFCFSALQRAENSSTLVVENATTALVTVSVLFSEPKIPQLGFRSLRQRVLLRFSALQRAENSSTNKVKRAEGATIRFSALQRAENSSTLGGQALVVRPGGFSALQRAENSSTRHDAVHQPVYAPVSVLFSEPKIPQPPR